MRFYCLLHYNEMTHIAQYYHLMTMDICELCIKVINHQFLVVLAIYQ